MIIVKTTFKECITHPLKLTNVLDLGHLDLEQCL